MLNYLRRPPYSFLLSPCVCRGTVGPPLCGTGFICPLWLFFRGSAFQGPSLHSFHCQSDTEAVLMLIGVGGGGGGWGGGCPLWPFQTNLL